MAAIFLGIRIRKADPDSAVAFGPADAAASRAATIRQLAFLGISVACALVLNTLGFIITMFILMASTSILVGNRRPLQILGISLAIPLGFYIAVTHVMRTALPKSTWCSGRWRRCCGSCRPSSGGFAPNHADRRAEIAE